MVPERGGNTQSGGRAVQATQIRSVRRIKLTPRIRASAFGRPSRWEYPAARITARGCVNP
jgi:hypothetical protein